MADPALLPPEEPPADAAAAAEASPLPTGGPPTGSLLQSGVGGGPQATARAVELPTASPVLSERAAAEERAAEGQAKATALESKLLLLESQLKEARAGLKRGKDDPPPPPIKKQRGPTHKELTKLMDASAQILKERLRPKHQVRGIKAIKSGV